MDPQQRAEMIWRMQELMYEDAVYPVLTYPYRLQAYDTDGWEGWTPLGYGGRGGGTGPAFYTSQNVDTYLNLRPADETGDGGGASRSIVAVIAIGVAAVIVGGCRSAGRDPGRRSGREDDRGEGTRRVYSSSLAAWLG